MSQVPILNGIYIDQAADFRTSYPRNLIPVPKQTGISQGYLRPAEGIEQFATGPGTDRGGFNWDGVLIRVMGSKLCRVSAAGAVVVLADVGPGGRVTIDNGFGYLSIWSGDRLYYWDGTTLTQVTDPDLGPVLDGCWLSGYNISTDGTSLIATDLLDKTQVNPLRYGSAESDPDPILGVNKLRNELIAFGRFSIEAFDNVGGDGFPFRRIEGAQVPRGVIGTHAVCPFAQTFAFVGSAINYVPAVYFMQAGTTEKISTAEIDKILERYSETQLAGTVLESRLQKGHIWLYVHLPDTTWIYDLSASQAVKEPVWYELNSAIVGLATYRARGLVWCYDRWIAGDPTTSNLGTFSNVVSTHYGQVTGWEFGTLVVYNDSRGAIVHELELVALPGRVAFGAEPVIWTSYSLDGETWSQERPVAAGKQGERGKRIAWRKQGKMRNYRMQRFRGTSDVYISFVRLEAQFEALYG